VDREALLEAFAAFPQRLGTAARAAADAPVVDGEWGPAEVTRHLVAVEREVWQSRLAQVAVEDDPQWGWTEPGPEPGLDGASLGTILAAYEAARAMTHAMVTALDDDSWRRFGTHATYGVLDVAGLLGLAIDHDREHLDGITGRA
jgi:DinB superfamily